MLDFLLEEDKQTLRMVLHRGQAAEAFWNRNLFRMGEGYVGRAAEQGTPLISPEEWLKHTHCGYEAPTDPFVKEVLAQNIRGEQCAIGVYQKLLQIVKDPDPVTYNIVLTILQQEVEHEEDLQSLDEDLDSLMMRKG